MKKVILSALPLLAIPMVYAADPQCGNIGVLDGTVSVAADDIYLDPSKVWNKCVLSGSIDTDTRLSSSYRVGRQDYNVVWSLDGIVTVGNGADFMANATTVDPFNGNPESLKNVTLVIEAGVDFRSAEGGALVITRGSKIEARGTKSQPITFASLDSDYNGNLEWGGVVILGLAKNNGHNLYDPLDPAYGDACGETDSQGDNVCNMLAEGIDRDQDESPDVYYGGFDNNDSSGVMEYVVIAEGGFELATAKEVNGLTLYSVGVGTRIDHIQVHGNYDDGVEFFGGNVNVSNLVLTANRDDSIDWDMGFSGSITNALIQQRSIADHGMELSGVDPDYDPTGTFDARPFSNPRITNLTLRGFSGSDSALNLKEGTGGTFDNLYVEGFPLCLKEANGTIAKGRLSFGRVTFSRSCSDRDSAYSQLGITARDQATPVPNFWSGWVIPGSVQ